MQVAYGTYTGDGSDNRSITGVGFQPNIVFIKGNAAQFLAARFSSETGDVSLNLANTVGEVADKIQSLDSDGFTIGTNAEVNSNTVAYYWTAILADAADCEVGSYVGNGSDNRNISIAAGFNPDLVIIQNGTGDQGVFRTSSHTGDDCSRFNGSANEANSIQGFGTGTFQVGTSTRVNTNLTTYFYAAFKSGASMAVGTYTGDGADNRDITCGFAPVMVTVKRGGTSAAVYRNASFSGDSSGVYTATSPGANQIQAFGGTTFQIGTNAVVNTSANNYYWFAFAISASVDVTPSAGSITVTGQAPGQVVGSVIPISAGAITVTGQTPTWSTITNVDVTPFPAQIAIVGQAPSVTATALSAGLLATDVRASLAAGRGAWIPVVEMTMPGGTRKYAAEGFNSDSGGLYEPRVIEWETIVQQISDRSGNMGGIETGFTLADTDRSIARLIEGPYGDLVKKSPVVIKLAHPDYPASSWPVRFTGVVGSWGWPEPMKAHFTVRVDDLQLQRQVPKAAWLITQADFKNCPTDNVGAMAPLIYGHHSQETWSGDGAVTCIYVDNVGFRYLVCAARALLVPRVYVDGTIVTSGYTVTYPVIAGRQYTLIDFTADKGESTITADVDGYEDVGDGTGELITAPTDLIAHFLSNWVFGDYRSGAWLATSSRIDTTKLASLASFLALRATAGAYHLGEQVEAANVLKNWLESFYLRGWWTLEGKLAFGVLDPTTPAPYSTTDPVLHDDAEWSMDYEEESVVSSITVSYVHSEAQQKYFQKIEVQDPTATESAEETLDQTWGVAG